MNETDDRPAASLPVTSEVGGEGGSFADPTVQVASFQGDLRRNPSGGDSETASRPVRSESVSANAGDEARSGVVRFPTEASARGQSAFRNVNWRAGAIGAVAGLAGAALAHSLSRWRHRQD